MKRNWIKKMNKPKITKLLAHMLLTELKGKNSETFDSWGRRLNADIFQALREFRHSAVDIHGVAFFVTHKNGGGAGMGSTPENITLHRIYEEPKEPTLTLSPALEQELKERKAEHLAYRLSKNLISIDQLRKTFKKLEAEGNASTATNISRANLITALEIHRQLIEDEN